MDWDCSENSDQGGICYDRESSLFSWDEAMVYDNSNFDLLFVHVQFGYEIKRIIPDYAVASLKSSADKQLQICKSGHRMLSLDKQVVNDRRGKSYKFSMKCTPMGSRTCVITITLHYDIIVKLIWNCFVVLRLASEMPNG